MATIIGKDTKITFEVCKVGEADLTGGPVVYAGPIDPTIPLHWIITSEQEPACIYVEDGRVYVGNEFVGYIATGATTRYKGGIGNEGSVVRR